MIGVVGVKLKHMIAIGDDGEIGGGLMSLHPEYGFQKGAFRPYVAHQQVQPQTAQRAPERIGLDRLIVHGPSFAHRCGSAQAQ